MKPSKLQRASRASLRKPTANPRHRHRMASESFALFVGAFLVAQILFEATKLCESQKPITLNLHQQQQQMQQHQQQQQQLVQQMSTTTATNGSIGQAGKQTTQLYKNYSLAMNNRPLERPSLMLGDSKSATNRDGQLHQQLPESASDWFMLNGGGAGGEGDLHTDEGRQVSSFASDGSTSSAASSSSSSGKSAAKSKQHNEGHSKRKSSSKSNRTSSFDDEQPESSDSNEIFDDVEGEANTLAGTQKEPECANHSRYYCTYKEDYPLKLVTEVTKYYKWPLEKLFRDLHAQIMPKLAQDSTGNLVCDSITRVVRPGWARNTNDRWLVVINTDNYHQYVTEVVCQYGTNSRCNFIPPCYYSSCQQRYNTQKLLVIDPSNPYRGPFLSEFLFPSCCVCYVPSTSESFQDKYKPSPATIYQRTMQQESSVNMNPPQFRPPGIIDDQQAHLADQSSVLARTVAGAAIGQTLLPSGTGSGAETGASGVSNSHKAPGVGEIRRGGDQYRSSSAGDYNDFPRLGLADSLISDKSNRETLPEVRQ